jgi:hypothetical protein
MAQTNYTPIQLYYSTTAAAVPVNTNLLNGELAINITDGKLYYKDNSGTVQVIATKGAGTIGGSTTQIQYNNAGALAGSSAMVFNNSTNVVTLTTLNLTNALGAIYGGTGQSTYTTGDLLYSSASNTLSKLALGTANYILTVNSGGTNVQWSAPSSISVSTATNLAGGVAGSVPYQSGASTTTFLGIGAADRVMTSSGSAPQWVTALTGLTGVSSSSITNTGLTSGRVVYTTTGGLETASANLAFDGTTLTTAGLSNSGTSALVKLVTVGGTSFNGTTVFAAATPAKLYMGTGTVTDATSAIGATNAVGAVASLAITPIAATNTSVTYTDAATLYIAGAPSAGTNITLTNPYALYIAAGNVYLGGGTANGVAYLNGSKVLTTGSALTFDGTNFSTTGSVLVGGVATTGTSGEIGIANSKAIRWRNGANSAYLNAIYVDGSNNLQLGGGGATSDTIIGVAGLGEAMRISSATGGLGAVGIGYSTLTSVGNNGLAVLGNVGIGTSSPTVKLQINQSSSNAGLRILSTNATTQNMLQMFHDDTKAVIETTYLGSGAFKDICMQTQGGNFGVGVTSITGGYKAQINGNLLLGTAANPLLVGTTSLNFLGDNTSSSGMRLDSSGNLGIGTTSPKAPLHVVASAGAANDKTLIIQDKTAGNAGEAWLSFKAQESLDDERIKGAIVYANSGSAYGVGNLLFCMNSTADNSNATTANEKMRLDSSGNLLVGATDTSATVGNGLKFIPGTGATCRIVGSADTNANFAHTVYSTSPAAYRFQVGWGGTIYATSTSITAISDASLKTNVRDLETGLTEVMALQPRRFDWINGDASNVAGFIAQEVQQVLPDLIENYQYNNEETKLGLKMGDILPTLVKAIQELKAEFDAYKASHP